MKPEWMKFVLTRNAENEGGGGGAGAGGSGSGEGEGGAAPAAGGDAAPPAAATGGAQEPAKTFLTEKKGGGEAAADAGEAKEGGEAEGEGEAPAAFDLTALTLPEGFELDEEVGKTFAEILSDDKLTPQERGQKFLDLHTTALKEVAESVKKQVEEASLKTYTEMNAKWRDEIKALPEFKANPDAEAGKVMQALLSVGANEDFFKALDLTGAGNNPAILQILHRLTSPLFEGTAVNGSGKPASTKRLGDNIYTSTAKP